MHSSLWLSALIVVPLLGALLAVLVRESEGAAYVVGLATSVVELISNPGVRIAALIEGNPQPVSYQGGVNPVFGPARGVVEFVPLEVFAGPASPRRLLTSGLGGVFPAGLEIGRVVRVSPSTDNLFKTGEVELDPRLSELTEVAVLVPAAPE